MLRWGFEDMQILRGIIEFVPVNMVDNFSARSTGNFSVLPLASVAFASISKASLDTDDEPVRFRCFLDCWARFCVCSRVILSRSHHDVSAAAVLAWGKARDFLRVCVKRIAVLPPHLVMPVAQFPCDHRSVAMQAGPANDLSAPSVLWGSVPLLAFVVHQAQAMRCMLSIAAFDAAQTVCLTWCHHEPPPDCLPRKLNRYEGIGNSSVEALPQLAEAAA